MDNYQLADIFSLLSKIMAIHGENSFKTRTYSNAAFQIEKLPEPLARMSPAAITAIKGIGDATGKKIIEILNTGNLLLLEKYMADTPPGVLEMINIKGIGPKKINIIWKEMEIESVGELLYACNEHRLSRFKGFGHKTEQNIIESVEFYLSKQGFFLFHDAFPINESILQLIANKFPSNIFLPSGDFRRHSETLEDLIYVTDLTLDAIKQFFDLQAGFHYSIQENETVIYRLEGGPIVKIHSCTNKGLATVLFLTTGSTEFINAFQQYCPGIEACIDGVHNEINIFKTAGMQFIPPFLREHTDIIETAKQNNIPQLIQLSDIKGIIHSHSSWSDGIYSLKQMATTAMGQGFEYLVISDHSRSAVYAKGLNADRITQQHLEINNLNKELSPFKIFKSIESDILADGGLDYPDEILQTFDLVIASVHSGLKMNEERATDRLIKAIENPYTTILGHMTGRLLLSRSGYPVNHKKVIDACAANHVVIELNAHSRRLDMDWRWIPYALSKNVLISIDPDAHSTAGFGDIKFGVLSAQKGMLTAKQNLSCFNLENFEAFLENQQLRKR